MNYIKFEIDGIFFNPDKSVCVVKSVTNGIVDPLKCKIIFSGFEEDSISLDFPVVFAITKLLANGSPGMLGGPPN